MAKQNAAQHNAAPNTTSTTEQQAQTTIVKGMATVVVSDKQSVVLPESKLKLGRSYGLDDATIARAYTSLQSTKVSSVLKLADDGFWKLQQEMQVKQAQVNRAARRADREDRLSFDKEELLAKARAALGMSEAEKTVIVSGRKALQPVKAPSPKAEKAPTVATGNGGNGKGAALVAGQDNPVVQ